ncbi:MAG: CTP synthase [Candidatus Aenigmatarchaeota archaeon]
MQNSSEMLKSVSKKTDESEFFSSLPKGYRKGNTKYIIITGTVISGVGKGTFSSSIGTLLKLFHGYRVAPIKFDGYLNYDAGTLNPYRHGEVFVLDDGTECDLDLGTYERMMNADFSKDNYLTAGKIFKTIIEKERAGNYLGRDVQFIPHVTGEIKSFIRSLAVKSDAEIILVEVGGTAGDIENSYFLEAMRELSYEEGRENVCFITVTYILQPRSLGEHKSKAAQLGLRTLMGLGIQPDIVICRSENPIPDKVREKISIYSNIPLERVISCYDLDNIYKIPLFLQETGIDKEIIKILNLNEKQNGNLSEFDKWKSLVQKINSSQKEITIGMVGKYTSVHDSYLSILKAIEHTSPYLGIRPKIKWIETTNITHQNVSQRLEGVDGIIVPGGFGERGTEGKIECIRYARENDIPYLGLCFGFQMAVIEFARNVCGLKGANSTEIDYETPHPVICILPEQEEIKGLGGTMRLGGFDLIIDKGTLAHRLYGKTQVRERFRHRWNVNPKYIETLEKNGMVFSGRAPEKRIMQILELPEKRFFLGTQFHPEFTSKPLNPHPLFRGFLEACLK